MANYAPDFTARLKVRYRAGGQVHTQTWRLPGDPSLAQIAAAEAVINGFYSALAPILWDDASILSVTVAGADSPVFLPIASSLTMSGDTSIATATGSARSAAASFVGRTAGGLRVIVFQYGIAMVPGESGTPSDFRWNPGEDVHIDDAVAALQGAGPALVGNDGLDAVWYSYVNFKDNDYWVGQVRG